MIRNGDTNMNRINPSRSNRSGLSARRLTLLASAAGLAIAMVTAGPSSYDALNLPSWTSSAHAAGAVQSPAGFADVVTKVKPSVISVRVKIDEQKK
jgi:serine protease Do